MTIVNEAGPSVETATELGTGELVSLAVEMRLIGVDVGISEPVSVNIGNDEC